jgi:hypothetical protein
VVRVRFVAGQSQREHTIRSADFALRTLMKAVVSLLFLMAVSEAAIGRSWSVLYGRSD